MGVHTDRITVFNGFLTKCQQSNIQNRDSMMNSVKYHGMGNKDYDAIYDLLVQYEHSAVEYFSDNDMEARSITHPRAGDIKDSVTNTTSQYKNPFLEAALWIRGEMLDIAGMINALKARDLVAKR